jgi:hypothetical protein
VSNKFVSLCQALDRLIPDDEIVLFSQLVISKGCSTKMYR